MTSDHSGTDLRYPLYLDVPMMVSFLAAIEDGVAYDASIHRRTGTHRSGSGDVSGGLKLPSLLGLLPFDLRGRLTGEVAGEQSEELQLVKRHTEASLFNRLRSSLHDLQVVVTADETKLSPSQIPPGSIVELSGTIIRNPLEVLLNLTDRIGPFIKADTAQQRSGTGQGRQPDGRGQKPGQQQGKSIQMDRRSGPNSEPDFLTILQWVKDDLRSADMMDIVLQLARVSPSSCVLTLSHDFGTGRTFDSLVGAQVTVMGKVTNVATTGGSLNLLRRSILGYMPEQTVRDMFEKLSDSDLFKETLPMLSVTPPYLQILPLAIFV